MAYGLLAGMPLADLLKAVSEGFGNTLGKIGLIIVLGIIIGAFLEHTGGARTIANSAQLDWKKKGSTGHGRTWVYRVHTGFC